MNRSALQFSLRAFFVAGVFCALFCVFCGYAMWFCWDLKNLCRRQISSIYNQRELINEDMSRSRALMYETSRDTKEYAKTAQHIVEEARMYFDEIQARNKAKFKIGQFVSLDGDNCAREAVVVGVFGDGTYLVAILSSRRTVEVAEENLTPSSVIEGGQ